MFDLEAERCADTVAAIEQAGGQALALGCDISDRGQVQSTVARLREAFGPVTVLVNNAAITGYVPFLKMSASFSISASVNSRRR